MDVGTCGKRRLNLLLRFNGGLLFLMSTKLVTLFLYAIVFSSCDFYIVGEGYVIDEATEQRLDSVQVNFGKQQERVVYSDSNGYFNMSFIVGATFNPPKEFSLVFKKEGYAIDTVLVPVSDTTRVALRRLP